METSNSTTDETSSRFLKDFFTTHRSKAFLETYGTNYRDFDKKFFKTANNKSRQAYEKANDQIEPPHIDINFPSPNQKTQTPSEWYGTKLAKQQAYQERRVFANRQCVRFGGCGGCSGASSNNHGDDDQDDDKSEDEDRDEDREEVEDKDGERDAQSKQSWQFSQLAKNFSAKEQKLFKTMAGRSQSIEEEEEEE